MERGDRAPVATFLAPGLPEGGGEVALGAAAAHHARVRRLPEGASIRLSSGSGRIAAATIVALRKSDLVAAAEPARSVARLPLLEVLVPVADRDRMLWLAEKCAEFGISVWQPVEFARSRSVTPRGEGHAFTAKVRARMASALEQSGGAWLPEVRDELPLDGALESVAAPTRYVLERGAPPLDSAVADDGVALVLGPEGGIELAEHALLERRGWQRVGLAPTTLRFETAGIAAVSILRAGVYR